MTIFVKVEEILEILVDRDQVWVPDPHGHNPSGILVVEKIESTLWVSDHNGDIVGFGPSQIGKAAERLAYVLVRGGVSCEELIFS